MTGKDLEIKPSVVSKAKFEYSPLRKVLNEGLNKIDKKEGILKRLKNIEDKTNSKLTVTKSDFTRFIKDLAPEQNKAIDKIKKQDNLIDYKSLYFRGGNNKSYDFRSYDNLLELSKKLYLGENTRFAEDSQNILEMDIEELQKYNPISEKSINDRKNF